MPMLFHMQIVTCLCVLTSCAQHKRCATIRHLNTTSQGWLSIQSCSVCGLTEVKAPRKTHRQRTAHQPISVILRYLFDTLVDFSRETQSCGNSQQRQRTRGVGQETLHERAQRSRLRYATDNSSTDGGGPSRAFALRQSTMSRRRFSFFFTKKTLSTHSGRRVRAVSPIIII